MRDFLVSTPGGVRLTVAAGMLVEDGCLILVDDTDKVCGYFQPTWWFAVWVDSDHKITAGEVAAQ